MIPGEDDEEEKQAQEPTYEGPEPASFIDNVNAQPLPANASNGKMPDEWPPAVPPEAPGMVPQAPPVGGPPQTPQAPMAAPPVNVPQEMAQSYADQKQLGDEDVAAQQKLGAAKANASGAEADALETEADRRQDAADEQAKAAAIANQRTQKWADNAQAETEKHAGMELHDYWADKSTGNKILGGLAMIVGAVGRTDNSGNAGMNMINAAMERDFRIQQARIAKQKDNVELANQQLKNGQVTSEQANKLKEASAVDAVAAKLVALKVRQGIPVEQAQNDADVVALKQKKQQILLGAIKDVHAINLEDAKLQIERQREADEKLKAEAYARKMGRTAGAGAAGGSLAPISQYIKDHPEDPAGAYAMAEKMGYRGPKAAALVDKLQNDFKNGTAGAKGKVPSVLTDTLTGQDLPVDPNRTDERKHNAAAAGLPQVNGAIQILDNVLKDADKPHAPEALSAIGFDTSPQADLKGQMTRFRSAYAASKKESVGEANAKELAEAIPDPPSNFQSTAAFNNWKRKIESTRKELHDSRAGLLANAGVPPDALKKAGANGGAPAAPAPAAAPAPSKQARAKAIVSDPSKRSLYSEQEWAQLIRKSMGN